MNGMNLASSMPEKKVKMRRTFDNYFIFITGIFFLVIVLFAGLRWYIGVLDKRLANFDTTLAENAMQLRGEEVDRVAHFDQRLKLIENQLDGSNVDSQKLLSQLEGLVIPSVKLTKYEYNKVENSVEIAGETDSFKSVAQQIISFKSENLFDKIKIESLVVAEGGRVEFVFTSKPN
jgi:hypothetical protein